MSIDTRLNPGFTHLTALDRPVLEGRQPGFGPDGVETTEAENPTTAPSTAATGQGYLTAVAWDKDGPRLFANSGLQLSGSDRSQSLDTGVDATVAPLA